METKSVNFESQVYKFPEPIEPGSKGNIVHWKFEGDPDKIVHLQPGCGCTADCKVDGNQIIATYNESDAVKLVNNDKVHKQYPDGLYPFSKSVTVFLDDGKPLKVINNNGISVFNQDKEQVILNFAGHVALPSVINTDK